MQNIRQKEDSQLEEKNHYIKQLENKVFDRFDQRLNARREIERKLFTLIEEKYNVFKIEISKESKSRFESIENLKNYLENDIPKLQGMVKFEQNEREEADNKMINK